MIGTTHFTNAVVQRRDLTPVAAVRIGLPASATLPPFVDWPEDLAALVRGGVFMVEGGHEVDGRPIVPFDEAGMRRVAREIRASGLRSVAVAAIFSPIDPACEQRAGAILAEECPGVAVTLSHELGRIGLLERENACLLNACLLELAHRTTRAFTGALAASGLEAPLYLTQNDGTVTLAGQAEQFPVYSFASGPTNSMRGAAFLSGLDDAVVIDVGGTTTDVGCLRHGFPREANAVVEVGGVRTLFRMPDLLSLGLGGGTLVEPSPLVIGPRSVGYRLTEEALVFGGGTLTCTDLAVAAGLLQLGDALTGRGGAARAGDARHPGHPRPDRRGDRPHEDRRRRRAGRGGRRRLVPGAGADARRVAGRAGRPPPGRQRRRRRHRPGQRRARPGLPEHDPRRRHRRGPPPGGGARRPRRRRPGDASRSSRWKTSPSPTCPATRCAPASASSAPSPAPAETSRR